MNRLALFALLILLPVADASAQTGRVKGEHIGCLTKTYLGQLQTAVMNRDKRLYDAMMGKTCILVKGQEFSILDQGPLTSKIRVYVGSDHVDLYVPTEATR